MATSISVSHPCKRLTYDLTISYHAFFRATYEMGVQLILWTTTTEQNSVSFCSTLFTGSPLQRSIDF